MDASPFLLNHRRMTDFRHVSDVKWLEESKERVLERQKKISSE